MRIGEKIKERRKFKRWKQVELANRVNVSPQVISNWERGYTHPDHTDVSKLSDALECSADYLLGRSDDPRLNETEDKEVEAEAKELMEILKSMPKERRDAYMDMLKAYAEAHAKEKNED
ncbi:helix-turn-helix domain-containing protein [Salipaludibacillus aurantiacus]|uniref:Helix-turn-helix n=1 Tax=Salipaludibacillus aurantiacus TaxID=1601833 RepID=A0A1H9U2A3_9BACI|nr:helix-turn-helix transcriptional regulator [Salipaludibacillus aurantiacus]SES03284.1 Helix-turn-helix [Salipaludibacillus aurantiacus]